MDIMKRKLRKTVCIDFDGVLNNYKGFDENYLGEPKPFVEDFLCKIDDYFDVVIFTARDINKVESWFYQHGLENIPIKITNEKVPAVAYIDDRAIRFDGNFNETLKELFEFEPYWKTQKDNCGKTTIRSKYHDLMEKLWEKCEEDPRNGYNDIESFIENLEKMKEKVILEAFKTRNLVWEDETETCEEK